jgi:hypothetical protein
MRRVLLVVALLFAACSSDDSSSSDATPCDELWVDGADTDTVVQVGDDQGCMDKDGTLTYMGNASYDCTDGRTLYWNDEGWGYSGDTWHQHAKGAEQTAPEDERLTCTG